MRIWEELNCDKKISTGLCEKYSAAHAYSLIYRFDKRQLFMKRKY